MVEPITCVPSPALIIPAATPAAEPLLDPPGVRRRSCGLRVPRGSVAANSVVTVLPRITAPASRNATTLAASRSERQPANSGEPCSVGRSAITETRLLLALVVIVNLIEEAAALGLERAVMDAGWPAGIGWRVERLAASSFLVVADNEIA